MLFRSETRILNRLTELEKKLYLGIGVDGKTAKLSDGKEWAIEMRRLRIELRELIAERISMEESTAENLADNAKFDFFVSECTYYDNGERVYKNIEDYNSKSADEIAFSAASLLGEMMYQLDTKYEQNLPENKWLKKFNLVNEELSLVNKEGDLVDTNGQKVNNLGYYVNEEGKRIDKEGNLLEEDGTYIITVNYQEESTSIQENKKRKTKQPEKETV